MAEVTCDIEFIYLTNDNGIDIDSVEATCSECDHTTQAYGQQAVSVRRCLVLMREECPMGRRNFYIAANGEDED